MGERRRAHSVLVAKPDRKGPLGSPRLEWNDNIKMDLLEVQSEARSVLILLGVGKGGGHLCMW